MKEMENPNNHHHHHHHLGVDKLGRTIKKIPAAPAHRIPPPAAAQANFYNISKSDFRSFVQQLTGTPTRDASAGPPPPRQPRANLRLQQIRPPPLAPLPRPNPDPEPNPNPNPFSMADYVCFVENSLLHSDGSRPTPPPVAGPAMPPPGPPTAPSSRAGLQLPSPGPFAMQSPSAFLNLVSPGSPYPLLSPGFQHPPPLSSNFPLSPGILGPSLPLPPPSPGFFPPSPSGLLPFARPGWSDL